MKRAVVLLLDSFGIGAAPDAHTFGDEGASTLGHIAEECFQGNADQDGLRDGPLSLPHLSALGLNETVKQCHGFSVPGLLDDIPVEGLHGFASEKSFGKDTPSGHWEITGVPVMFEWGYFKPDYPSFPQELIDEFCSRTGVPGVLGNKAASGTTILEELGDEHIRTGKPIVYTSADSVFQIAAHEETFGLERLYECCKVARELVNEYNIGRVIARPFVGENGNYSRTTNRHDYSVTPPAKTLFDKLVAEGGSVIGIGKTADIFAHQGITKNVKAHGIHGLFDATLEELKHADDRSLIFTNFVNFDMDFGHRRDVAGYAHALEEFDRRLPELKKVLKPGDVVVITADHGCDPTFKGTDHTREYIPILMFGSEVEPKSIGHRATFADIGQSLAQYFNLESFDHGESFL